MSWFGRRGAATPPAAAGGSGAAAGAPAGAGSPLELIRYDAATGKFELGREALQVLKNTRGPVGVVAVCGRARQVSPMSRRNAQLQLRRRRRRRSPSAESNSRLCCCCSSSACLASSPPSVQLCTLAGQVLHPQPAAGPQRRLPGCAHAPPLHQGCAALAVRCGRWVAGTPRASAHAAHSCSQHPASPAPQACGCGRRRWSGAAPTAAATRWCCWTPRASTRTTRWVLGPGERVCWAECCAVVRLLGAEHRPPAGMHAGAGCLARGLSGRWLLCAGGPALTRPFPPACRRPAFLARRRASTPPRSSRWRCCCPACLCSTRWAASTRRRWTGAAGGPWRAAARDRGGLQLARPVFRR